MNLFSFFFKKNVTKDVILIRKKLNIIIYILLQYKLSSYTLKIYIFLILEKFLYLSLPQLLDQTVLPVRKWKSKRKGQ